MSDPRDALDSEIDRLYSLPLSQFVEARNALAAQLRQEKRGPEAGQVKVLAKPSLAAWAVNQLYWKRRPMWDGLVRAGDALRSAAGKSSDPQLTQQRRDSVAKLLTEAEGILAEAGHASGASTIKQVHDSLEAVSVYGEQLPGEPAGRFTRSLEPPGFEALLSLAAAIPTRARASARAEKAAPETPAKPRTTSAGLRFARARLAKAERETARKRRQFQEASALAAELEQRAAKCQAEIDGIESRLQDLRQKLELASKESEKSRQAAETAAAELARSEADLESARQKVDETSA